MTKQFKIAQDIVKLTISKAKYKEMQKDKKRLDWLEKSNDMQLIFGRGANIRSAIDAAMKKGTTNGNDL